MAELPRYRKMGIQYADLPKIGELSTAGTDVAARGMSSLASKLDQLQDYFYKKSVEEAEMSARRYAAENPVTQEQIDAAKNPKNDLQALLAGEGGPVYRRALLEAQGKVLAEQLKIDGTRKIADLMASAEKGQINSWQVQNEVIDMIDGFSATVSAFDPESAIRLRADLSTRGNTAIKTTMAEESKRGQMLIASKFEEQLQSDQIFLEEIYNNPDQVDPSTGEVISVEDRIEVLRQTYYSSVEMTGKDTYLKEFNKRVNETRIDAIVKVATDAEFAGSPAEAYSRMKSGDLGMYQGVWDSMTLDDKNESIDRLLKNVAAEKKLQNDNAEIRKGELIKEAQSIQMRLYTEEVPPEEKKALVSRLIDINAEAEQKITSTAELKAIQKGKTSENEAPDSVMFTFEGLVDSGQMSPAMIAKEASEGNLSWEQARALQNRHKAIQSKSLSEALRFYEAQVQVGLPSYQQRNAKDDIAVVKSEIVDAVRENPDIDPKELARQKVEEAKKLQADEAKEAVRRNIAVALKSADIDNEFEVADMLIQNPDLADNLVENQQIREKVKKYLKRLQ